MQDIPLERSGVNQLSSLDLAGHRASSVVENLQGLQKNPLKSYPRLRSAITCYHSDLWTVYAREQRIASTRLNERHCLGFYMQRHPC